MTRSDQNFYRARVRQEYELAKLATHDCARRVHLELARLYTKRLRDIVLVVS